MWNIWKTKEDYEAHLKENGLGENVMAKKRIVEFKKGDGLMPGRSEEPGRPFLLKTPVNVTVERSGMKAFIRLGVSCNLLTVVLRRGSPPEIFGPGQELGAVILNTNPMEGGTSQPLVVGVGETVARCYPIDCTDLELSDA